MFFNWGRNCKLFYRLERPEFEREWRRLSGMLDYIEFISVSWDIIIDFRHMISSVITEDKVLLIKLRKDYIEVQFEITLIKEENIGDYLPAVNCPNYKIEETIVDLENHSFKHYFSNLNNLSKVLIIRRSATTIKIESVIPPEIEQHKINLDKDVKEQLSDYLNWPIDYWWWKPTGLKINSSYTNFSLCQHIFENIKTIKAIKTAMYWDKDEFEELLIFLIINKPIKIFGSPLLIRHPKNSECIISLKARSLVFVKNSIPTPFKVEGRSVCLEGTIQDRVVIDGQEWIAFKFTVIYSFKFSMIEYDQNSKFKMSKCYNQLDKYSSKDITNLILFKDEDIYRLEKWDSRSLEILSDFKNFKKIKYQIYFAYNDYDFYVKEIDLLSKESDIEINFSFRNTDAIDKLPLEFWKKISKLKNSFRIEQRSSYAIPRFKLLQVIWDVTPNDWETKFLEVMMEGQVLELNLRILHELVGVKKINYEISY